MKKYFGFLLLAELAVIAVVVTIFRSIPDRFLAGAIAGTVFVLLGGYIVVSGLVEKEKRGLSFWLGLVHLFVTSLPMMITRLLNSSTGFAEVNILGLPGPVFHRLSTTIYMILLIATALDFIFAWRRQLKGR